MDMDIEQFRQHLTDWGVNAQVLAVIGITSLVLFMFSLRVVLKWYLGLQNLESQLARAREQLSDIQKRLAGGPPKAHGEEPSEEQRPAAVAGEEPKKNPFRLTH